jgi:hypothetical protein
MFFEQSPRIKSKQTFVFLFYLYFEVFIVWVSGILFGFLEFVKKSQKKKQKQFFFEFQEFFCFNFLDIQFRRPNHDFFVFIHI